MKTNRVLFVVLAVLIATASRLLPHPLNITPLIGMTLLSAAYMPKRWMAIALPMLSWFISDLFVNMLVQREYSAGFSYFTTYPATAIGVYLSLILVHLLGTNLRKGVNMPKLALFSVSSSLLFYFVTNSLVFFEGYYGYTFGGYISCMVAGIPFYKSDFGTLFGSFFLNGIMGDLFYTAVLFGGYYLVNQRSLKPAYA